MFLQLFLTALAGGGIAPTPPATDFSALPATADVQPKNADGKDHQVRARLLTDRTAAAPGESFRLGLHLTQAEGWHTYWKSPGDTGLPTQIEWTFAPVTVDGFDYPKPERFVSPGDISFGYDGQVLLFTEVTLPADATPGEVTLSADASWLVCKTSCIPGSASPSMTFTIGEGGQPTEFVPLFDHFSQRHPKTPDDIEGLDAQVVLSQEAVRPYAPFTATIVLSAADRIEPGDWTFAPIVGDGWMVNEQTVGHIGDDLVVRIEGETLLDAVPESDRIGGLFLLKLDGEVVAVEVEQELPWKAEGVPVVKNDDPLVTASIDLLPDTEAAVEEAVAEATPVIVLTPDKVDQIEAPDGGFGLLGNLVMAFIGGLILNIMPCVLPVLTLKLYSLIEQVDVTRAEQKTAGIAYTAGILASFAGLAITTIALRAALGTQVGWGFQMQYPAYVATLTTLVFAMGLSLFGVFEIPAFGTGAAASAENREGPAGYFATGVFATLVATPCSAPILGTATAFAMSASAPSLFAIFAMIGLGLAAPFLLIAFVPALYRLLPRPGAWMETFKQLLGFSLIATAIWLLGVLGSQIGQDRMFWFLCFLTMVSLGAWIFGRYGGVASSLGRQVGAGAAGLAVIAVGWLLFVDLQFGEPECDDGSIATSLDFSEHIPWQPFSDQRVEQLKGQTIFVDFTAEWCVSCKFNEKTILETQTVRDAMAQHGIVPLKADWTRQDDAITQWLLRYGKAGVPFYLVIPAEGEPIPLGETITPGSVIAALQKAKG